MVMGILRDAGIFAKVFLLKMVIKAFSVVRSLAMGSGTPAALKSVELHEHPYPNFSNFQDIVITSNVAGVDVTNEYKTRLGFVDPRTLLYDVNMKTIWETLCRGVEGVNIRDMGRTEVTFSDSFGKEKKLVFTPANEKVVLPLHKKITPVLSPGLRKVMLEIDRKDIYPEDGFNDEATVLSDCEDDDTEVCTGSFEATDFFSKWIPNKKVAKGEVDISMYWLALRDTILGDESVKAFFETPKDLESSVFDVQINLVFSDQSIHRETVNFSWTPYTFRSKLV